MSDYGKGICAECQRTIGGRLLGMAASRLPRKVELSRHNAPDGRPCNGGGKVVLAAQATPVS